MDITLIGPMLLNTPPKSGEVAKNQNLYSYFVYEKKLKIKTICTYNWKTNPFILLKLFINILFNNKPIIISCNTSSAYKLFKMIYFLKYKADIYYFVVGNTILQGIEQNNYNKRYFKFIKKIYVEGKETKNRMNEMGMSNVFYLPNFKNFNKSYLNLPLSKVHEKKPVRFVFISRIDETKGVEIIFDTINKLRFHKSDFNVTFFGSISKKYKSKFFKNINLYDNVEYGGFLNLNNLEGYKKLSSFNVMLFPTIWIGEGFPGVIIDAFISGLPVIASNWNLNSELIYHNQNGLLIKPNSTKELSDSIIYFIRNKKKIREMAIRSKNRAINFHTNNILKDLSF